MAYARMDILPSGVFLTIPALVGTTDEELEAQDRRELHPDRIEAITNAMAMAVSTLRQCEAAGRC